MSESAALGTVETNGHGGDAGTRVSFSDVARAHYEWDARDGADERARREFERKLELFEAGSHSALVEAYWCRRRASAVALAQIDEEPDRSLRQRLRRFVRGPVAPEFRLYRETDWLTGDFSKLADLLHECDVLAVKAIYGLEGFQQSLVMQWLLKVEAHVLGYIEWRHPPDLVELDRQEARAENAVAAAVDAKAQPVDKKRDLEERQRRQAVLTQLESFYVRVMRELSKIEDYYQAAGEKRARLNYVEGMITAGMVAVTVAAVAAGAVLSVFGLLDLHHPGVRRFYACLLAGAIGAVVSVLIRMSGRGGGFTIDHELGSFGVRRLGAFRPLIGAVSGVIVSFLVQTSLVPIDKRSLSIEFYVVVAFLAGFSERWTKVVLDGAMRTIDKVSGDDRAQETAGAPPSPAAAAGGAQPVTTT